MENHRDGKKKGAGEEKSAAENKRRRKREAVGKDAGQKWDAEHSRRYPQVKQAESICKVLTPHHVLSK